MRRGVELLREQNVLWFDGLLKIALADSEDGAGDPGCALAVLDEALAQAERVGYRAFEAEQQRARGEILLEQGPANSAPAEEALLTAVAVARGRGRAASNCARRFRSQSSINRLAVRSRRTTRSRRLSKALRRRRKCPRSLRRMPCWSV